MATLHLVPPKVSTPERTSYETDKMMWASHLNNCLCFWHLPVPTGPELHVHSDAMNEKFHVSKKVGQSTGVTTWYAWGSQGGQVLCSWGLPTLAMWVKVGKHFLKKVVLICGAEIVMAHCIPTILHDHISMYSANPTSSIVRFERSVNWSRNLKGDDIREIFICI